MDWGDPFSLKLSGDYPINWKVQTQRYYRKERYGSYLGKYSRNTVLVLNDFLKYESEEGNKDLLPVVYGVEDPIDRDVDIVMCRYFDFIRSREAPNEKEEVLLKIEDVSNKSCPIH